MRDILFMLLFCGLLPGTLIWPEVGVLLWTWLSYMTPQKVTYGFARDLPLTQLTALVTLTAWGLAARVRPPRLSGTTWLMLGLFLCYGLSTALALNRAAALPVFIDELKKLLLCLMFLAVIDSRRKLNALLAVMALSLGYFGTQAGVFTILTGGAHLVVGPPGSYIEDNNGLAVVMIMSLPLMTYFFLQTDKTWLRWLIALAIALSVFAILGTRSRGGFLAVSACLGFLWWKSRHRSLAVLLVLAAMLAGGLLMMPDEWYQRISTLTLERDEIDKSALGRLEAWEHALNIIAHRPLLGAGFDAFSPEVFFRFTPDYQPRAAHSIYFQLLGEHGLLGFTVYFAMLYAAWRNGGWLIRHARRRPEAAWAGDLGRMLQVCLIAFVVGGAFLSLARIEPIYGVVAVSTIARAIARREAQAAAREKERAFAPASGSGARMA